MSRSLQARLLSLLGAEGVSQREADPDDARFEFDLTPLFSIRG